MFRIIKQRRGRSAAIAGMFAASVAIAAPAAHAAPVCGTAADQVPTPATKQASMEATKCLINGWRQAVNAWQLWDDADLVQGAYVHTKDMVTNHFYGTTGSDGSNPQSRLKAYCAGNKSPYNKRDQVIEKAAGADATPRKIVLKMINNTAKQEKLLSTGFSEIGVWVSAVIPSGAAGATVTVSLGYCDPGPH